MGTPGGAALPAGSVLPQRGAQLPCCTAVLRERHFQRQPSCEAQGGGHGARCQPPPPQPLTLALWDPPLPPQTDGQTAPCR